MAPTALVSLSGREPAYSKAFPNMSYKPNALGCFVPTE